MTTDTATPALRRVAVRLDGIVTLPSSVLVAVLAGVLAGPVGVPTGVLVGIALFVAVWGAVVLYLGTRAVVDRRVARVVGIVNLVFAVDGVVIALFVDLTTFGTVAVLVLTAAIIGIGVVQLYSARR